MFLINTIYFFITTKFHLLVTIMKDVIIFQITLLLTQFIIFIYLYYLILLFAIFIINLIVLNIEFFNL